MGRLLLPPLLLLFTVLYSVLCAGTPFDIMRKKTIIRYLGQCKGGRALPVLFHDVRIAPDERTGGMSLSGKVTVRKEVTTLTIVLNFWRCDASGNLDSCECILKDYNATNVCRKLAAKKEIWTLFMDHFDMPAKCPVKVGLYNVTKAPITADILKYLPVQDALWKVRLTGWDSGRYVACVVLEDQVITSYKARH